MNNELLPQIRLDGKKRIIEKLNDTFDVNYKVSQIKISTLDEFFDAIYTPFIAGERIFYRGEKINSSSRKLLPTFLRNDELVSRYDSQSIIRLDYNSICDFYNSKKQFMSVYEAVYDNPKERNTYKMLAFAQHYLGVSPFIDFTKNLFVALSFALKGREVIDDDIVLYSAYDVDFDDTCHDINEVNSWLENYSVNIIKSEYYKEKLYESLRPQLPLLKNNASIHKEARNMHGLFDYIYESVSPIAKLIDIPTNDLMRYQQGVFLLLNDFCLVDSSYLTNAVRQSFIINKYIINAEVANHLRVFLLEKTPQYRYDCLLNISLAVNERNSDV